MPITREPPDAAKSIRITRGLDIPIAGEPEQVISETWQPGEVALVGHDYIGLKPHMAVSVGDRVKLGQPLFSDKSNPAVQFTSPAAGRVVSINRGERRRLESVVIGLDGREEICFDGFSEDRLESIDRKTIVGLLIESGLWTSFRCRPFSRVPNPEIVPHSLFVTAMDTNPLAPSVGRITEGNERQFTNGLKVLSRLTGGRLFLCKARGEYIPDVRLESLTTMEFSGPHPAGNVGTHIHFLDPVGRDRQAWHIQAQDVISVGLLFTTGRINVDRVISLAGPSVKRPRLIKTRIGASVDDLTSGELKQAESRIISGSILSGHTAAGATAFLGRYHQQVSVIPEGRERVFLGWLRPGLNLHSSKRIVLSRLFPKRKPLFNTSANGSRRALYPIGSYEKIMPLDIIPTALLRALAVDDIEEAEELGCLELDEEDLALCSYVCPSKIDHGVALRRNLTLIEREGL